MKLEINSRNMAGNPPRNTDGTTNFFTAHVVNGNSHNIFKCFKVRENEHHFCIQKKQCIRKKQSTNAYNRKDEVQCYTTECNITLEKIRENLVM
jgi:hypothetical protein